MSYRESVMKLSEMTCVPPKADDRPLSSAKAAAFAGEVRDWVLIGGKKLTREFTFAGFPVAMEFVNKAAFLAEVQGHHPDIYISYRAVRMTLTTHKIGGLSRNDFIMAAKIDELAAALPSVGTAAR